MSRLEELLKQQQEISAAIEEEKRKGREEALANVRATIAAYGFTLSELKRVIVTRKPRSASDARPMKSATAMGKRRGRPPKNPQ